MLKPWCGTLLKPLCGTILKPLCGKILKPLRGKNLKKKIGWYNSEKHLCGKFGRLKCPCEDEGKNALVW